MLDPTWTRTCQNRLRALMERENLDLLYLSDARDIYYATGQLLKTTDAAADFPSLAALRADGSSWLVSYTLDGDALVELPGELGQDVLPEVRVRLFELREGHAEVAHPAQAPLGRRRAAGARTAGRASERVARPDDRKRELSGERATSCLESKRFEGSTTRHASPGCAPPGSPELSAPWSLPAGAPLPPTSGAAWPMLGTSPRRTSSTS